MVREHGVSMPKLMHGLVAGRYNGLARIVAFFSSKLSLLTNDIRNRYH